MASTHPIVELTDLRKQFKSAEGPVNAVSGINLTINRGEIVAFLGPNGAGKTTTIDMMLGLTTPTSGTVRVAGHAPREAVSKGMISAVLQTGGLLRDLTVGETLTAIGSLHNGHINISNVVERANLEHLLKRRVSKCSGGEQQRVKFALALLCDPDVLILDEPTAGMDVNARRDFWAAMQQDADSGRTIIFATHYLEEAEAFAERTILVSGGRVIADGPTAEIRSVAAGREVSADIAAHLMDHTKNAVRELPGVTSVEVSGGRIKVSTKESDLLARYFLDNHAACNLEISAPSLESAFMNLTGADR